MVNFGMSGILKNILFKQLISFSKCVAFLYQKRFSYYLNLIYMKKQYVLLLGLLVFSIGVFAQNTGPIYDVLVKGGHVMTRKMALMVSWI